MHTGPVHVCMYMFRVCSVFLQNAHFPIHESSLSSKRGKGAGWEGSVRSCFIGMCMDELCTCVLLLRV